MSKPHEEEALGKPYDSRLMRRLLEYMRPYKWRVILALTLTLAVTPLELAPPKLFQVAVDRYLVPGAHQLIAISQAKRGLVLVSLIYLLVLFIEIAHGQALNMGDDFAAHVVHGLLSDALHDSDLHVLGEKIEKKHK